jgi:hypothetical protein
MSDEIKQIVKNMVDTFKGSKRAQLWHSFTDDLREALIDACVMDQVRSAAAWRDQTHAFTARELMDIRRAFVRALHEGIPRRGSPPLRFMLEGNQEEGPP